MATKLRRLAITEVAMVDEGANPGAAIVFSKRKDPEDNMVFNLESIPEAFRKSVSDELARVAKEKDDATKTAVDTAVAAAIAKAKTPEPAPPVVEEPVPTEVQKRLDLQSAELVALRKRLEEKDESEFVAVTKAALPNIADIDNIAKSLYRVSKADKELAATVTSILKGANVAVAKSGVILSELGSTGNPVSTAEATYEKVVTLAKSKVAADKSLTIEKAISQVYSENKALYDLTEAEAKQRK